MNSQWTKPAESAVRRACGDRGKEETTAMQETAVKRWEPSGQRSTPEEADSGGRTSDFSIRAAEWGPQCLLAVPLGPQDNDGGICPRVGRMRGGNMRTKARRCLVGTTQEEPCGPQVRSCLLLPLNPASLCPTLISSQARLPPSPAPILFPRESHYIGGERNTAEGRSKEVCIIV